MIRVLGLALLVVTLAACGGEGSASQSAPPAEPTTDAERAVVTMFKAPT